MRERGIEVEDNNSMLYMLKYAEKVRNLLLCKTFTFTGPGIYIYVGRYIGGTQILSVANNICNKMCVKDTFK